MHVDLLPLPDRLLWVIECFCKTMAPESAKQRIGLLSGAIWNRVKRFERRFCALYAQWKAGILPKARVRKSTSPRLSPHGGEGELAALAGLSTRPASLLPRAFAWLYKMLPMSGGTLAGGLETLLLNYPETRAFVADCPQVGRMLRPMCRMAGLKPPEWLALPKRARVRVADPPPQPSPSRGEGEGTSLRSSPHGGEGEEEALRRLTARFPDTPAARAAKRALARSLAGLPVNLKRLSAVAYGYYVHPPRDGNCPPPEIGYARSRLLRRVPKDYAGFSKKWD